MKTSLQPVSLRRSLKADDLPVPLRYLPVLLALPLLATDAAALELESCHLPGIRSWARCGTLSVPENPDQPDREIGLRVAVLPALQDPPEPDPVFVLAGGPGQSAVAIAPLVSRMLLMVNRHRDIVLIDQRGTGESNPFRCDVDLEQITFGAEARAQFARSCLTDFEGDVSQYTTLRHIGDLEQARQALGYDRINLYGGSYGTRVGLVYLREHPEVIRSAVLDGVASMDMRVGLAMGGDAQLVLDRLAERCLADPVCSDTFGDPRTVLTGLKDQLAAQPVAVAMEDPQTGQTESVEMTPDQLALALRALLYSPTTQRLVPLILAEAAAGNWEPFVGAAMAANRDIAEMMNLGLMLAVLCSEDLAGMGVDDIDRRERESFVGAAQAATMLELCAGWPASDEQVDWTPPSDVTTPVLLLSGGLDPATPPYHAEAAAQHLANSRHLVVETGGHIVAAAGCMPQVVSDFFQQPDPDALDVECIEEHPAPSFFVNLLGPKP